MSKWIVLAGVVVSLFHAMGAQSRSLPTVPGRGPRPATEIRTPVFVQATVPQSRMFEDRRDIPDEDWAKLDGRPYVVGWHVRDLQSGMFGDPSSRDVSGYTGLAIPWYARERAQLGYPGAFSTQVASYANQLGLLVVPGSWSPSSITRDHTPIYQTTSFLEKRIHPFEDPESRVEARLELQIPSLSLDAGEQIVTEFNILFRDETSGERVGIITVIFDPRGVPKGEGVLFEFCHLCTQSLWGGHGLNSGARWITLLEGTEEGQSSTWRGWKKFGFSISASQFKDLLQTIGAAVRNEIEGGGEFAEDAKKFENLCLDPACYTFSLLTFGPEAHKDGVTGGTVLWNPDSHLGMSIRNMRVDRVTPR